MKPTRYFSKKQEKAVAASLGGKTTPNSGATLYSKGDAFVGKQFLLECKTSTTPKQSFSVKKQWLQNLAHEKISMGKEEWALVFNFGPNQENYYIVSENTFKQLIREEE